MAVCQGKLIELDLIGDDVDVVKVCVDEMCQKFFFNLVIESYLIEIV